MNYCKSIKWVKLSYIDLLNKEKEGKNYVKLFKI